jgi:DNA-binding MarR family transcriptional regulator
MKQPASVIDLLSSRFLRLSNTLGLYASRRYREEFGITLPEWRVLSIIASFEPTAARDVSRILATDKGWVGTTAESLRRRGLIAGTPDKQDGRRTLLSLTKEGRALHDAVLSVARWRQHRLLHCLPEGAGKQLVAYLDLLQAEADAMLAESVASSDEDIAR